MTTKQILTSLALTMLIAGTGCRKDAGSFDPVDPVEPVPSQKLLLSKKFRNGDLNTEYIYDTERKIVRVNTFNSSNPEPSFYGLYEYNTNDQFVLYKTFTTGDLLNTRTQVSYNNDNSISAAEIYNSLGNLSRKISFEYNAAKQVIRQNEITPLNQVYAYIDYAFNNDGVMISQKRYVLINGQPILNYDILIEPEGDKSKYDHWNKYRLFPSDMSRSEMLIKTFRNIHYNNGVVESDYTETTSGKSFNSAGYLTKQTITRKFTVPVQPDVINNYEYQYIQ